MFRVFLQQQSRSDTKKEALEAVTIVETPASHCCRWCCWLRRDSLWPAHPRRCLGIHLSDEVERRFYKNRYRSKKKTFARYAKNLASSHTQIRKTDLSQKTAHHRTELNKKIYRIGLASDDANALTESDGSIPGTRKRVITIRKSLMVHTSRRDLEKVQLKFHRHIVEHGAFQTFEEKATFLDVLKPPPRGAIKHLCYLTVVFGVVLCATSIIRSPADSELAKRGCSSSSLATMGIPDYWKLVNAASETISLKLLAAKGGTPGVFRVGIDACLWITQCQAVFHKPRHAQMGRNPELRALFYKAAALNAAGAEGGPLEKRGKRVKAKPHWLIEEFQEMVKKMGFHVHQAPGEAEAKLARLNYIGWIDAVLTDDGDAALFGATCIIRSLDKKNTDSVTIYASTALASHPSVQLTRGGIFLLAPMHGGDYDTIGLPKCGMGLAHGLARCGFGDALLGATQTMNDADLSQFLVGWREAVREELATNARGYLKSKHKLLAGKKYLLPYCPSSPNPTPPSSPFNTVFKTK
ncbi:PIN domain-like protein [Favolaschia claudopus]|uniref:PIN domain-like protein n=1 Tax=Favolaschia claudopus TaxID=2862362 RepID=A0AAW0AU81_9AGAR